MTDSSEVFLARQPIFDRKVRVVGYEIVFRGDGTDGDSAGASNQDPRTAAATVAINALTEIGLERLVASNQGWINLPGEFLLSEIPLALPPEITVFELLEDALADQELVEAAHELKRRGYRIALDHFVYSEKSAELLPLADAIKLDFLQLGREGIAEQMKLLQSFGGQKLAEKIESHEDHEFCMEAGCDLFQGFFYSKPELMSKRRITVNRAAVMQVIAALQNPALQFDEIEPLIARDVDLSVRLLRYINSAFFGLTNTVGSVRQALVLMGLDDVKRWATMATLGSLEGKPSELTNTALLRARFCELAGAARGYDASQMFTLGLFSLINAMLDIPLEEAMEELPLPPEMVAALLRREGEMGDLLSALEALEAGYFGDAKLFVPEAGDVYVQALLWANGAADALSAAT